jgi:hypothetical protein
VSEELTLTVSADISKAETDVARLNRQTDAVVREWNQQHKVIQRQLGRVMFSIRSITGIFRATLRVFGVAMDPIQDAIINAIMVTMSAALAIHRTLEAATVGLAGVVTISLSAISVGLGLQAIMAAQQGLQKSQQMFEAADTAIMGVEALIMGVSGWF